MRVLILGVGSQQNHFTQILAANIQQWGFEASILSTSAAAGRDDVEGDILVYDLDDELHKSTLFAGKQLGSMSPAVPSLLASDEGRPRVRLMIALSSRSVSRLTLERIGAVALLYKPFKMVQLQRYLHVFQQVLFDERVRENGSKSDEAFLSAAPGSVVRENMYEGYQTHGQSARILVVDDHEQVAEAIQQCLECESHYEVRVANDGLDALEQYVAWQPDCIVTDLLMPYMDGYQVMRSLSAAGTRQMPAFVVISALPQRELPEQHAYPREKSVVFIDKPFQIDHLLDAVERALV